MIRKPGEKLFTIEFSSSYDESYEETPRKSSAPPQNKPIVLPNQRTRQIPKEKPDLGGLIEISDSYYEYSDNGKSSISKVTYTKQLHTENNDNDIKNISSTSSENDQEYSGSGAEVKVIKNQIQSNTNNIIINNNLTDNDNLSINDSDKLTKSSQQTNDTDDDHEVKLKSPPRQSRPVYIPPQTQPDPPPQENNPTKRPEYPIYLVKRETKTHINGRRLFFNLYKGEEQIYTAKCKTKNAHHVYIMKGNEVHIKSTADAVILVGNDGCDFSLRKKEDLGDEILTVRILPPKTSADTTRRMSVCFFERIPGTPKKIFSKKPTVNPDGKIEHDFNGRFAIGSIKNAVLVSKPEGPNLLYIRKTGNNEIEIEPRFNHDDLWILALGIASFLSRVKGSK